MSSSPEPQVSPPGTQQTTQQPRQQASARTILGLAWPALVVLAATPIYLLWDTAVVGRLGAQDLAALAAGATVLGTVTTQLTFLSYGTTARAARHFGAGRRSSVIYEGLQATWVAVAVGAVLALLVFSFAPHIMGLFSSDATVVVHATEWMRVTCLSIIPALCIMAGNGWLRGMSNTRLPLWFTLAGVIPMIVTVPVFVGRFGLVGSAYANVLGEFITAGCFVSALRVYWKNDGDGRSVWPQWGVIKGQLMMGRDLIARSLSFQVAFISAAAVAGRMGAAPLAAHQILLQLWNFLTLVLDSVAIAAQALVGAALGAGVRDEARRVGNQVIRFSVLASAVLALVLGAGAWVIPGLFTTDRQVLMVIGGPWWMLVVLVLLGGVVFALDGVLLGAADVAFLRKATIASVVVGFIPVVWAAYAFGWGLVGVWCGIMGFLILRFVAVVWRYRGDRWMDKQID